MSTADGEFRFGGVPPGAYRITLAGLANDWHVASGLINGVESLDFPVEIRAGQETAAARVVISNDATLLSGRLVDARLDDPGYLRLLAQQALRFTLGTNQKLTQTFRIAGGT
jgi:hypothetical protein